MTAFVHPFNFMTTATLNAPPVRKRRTRAKVATTKPMQEQINKDAAKIPLSSPAPAPNYNFPNKLRTDSHLPDIQVLTREALLKDLSNRAAIHQYEVKEVMKELKQLMEMVQPHARNIYHKIKSLKV